MRLQSAPCAFRHPSCHPNDPSVIKLTNYLGDIGKVTGFIRGRWRLRYYSPLALLPGKMGHATKTPDP